MSEGYKILDSALKHGITELEIDEVLREQNLTRRSYELPDDGQGNARDMCVAYVGTRPWPIEIGICYGPTEDVVFHASRITPRFRELYEAEP